MPVSQSDLNDIVASLFVAVVQQDAARWKREVADAKAICTEEQQNFIWDQVQAAVSRHKRNRDADVRDHASASKIKTSQRGIRFSVGGTTEKLLEQLAGRRADANRHDRNMADDLAGARQKIKDRTAVLLEAQRQALTAVGPQIEEAQKAVLAAEFNLALAVKAEKDCLGRLRGVIDPVTGKIRSHAPGRAPEWVRGPAETLDREYAARARFRGIDGAIGQLPELKSADERWARLTFPWFVDSPRHEHEKWQALSVKDMAALTDVVLAFVLYANRELSRAGIPVTIWAAGNEVRVEHTCFRNRLNEADFDILGQFVDYAAARLKVRVKRTHPLNFRVRRSSAAVDYRHVVRNLRSRSWRDSFATDEDIFADVADAEGDDIQRIVAPLGEYESAEEHAERFRREFDEELESIRAEHFVWRDPMPRLEQSGLPFGIVRLFKLCSRLRKFERHPQAALDKRTPGIAWMNEVSGYRVNTHEVAGELYLAIINGDLDAAVWYHQYCLIKIADNVVQVALELVERQILASSSNSPSSNGEGSDG